MREERAQADKAMQEDHTQASNDVETAPTADLQNSVISTGEADASAQAEQDAEAAGSAHSGEAAIADSDKAIISAGEADVSGPDCNLESDAAAEASKFLEGSDVGCGSAAAV